MNLIFHNAEEVVEFVRKVGKYPFHMDLCRGSVVVDAKSLLGVLNLGFNQTVMLKVYADDCEAMYQEIKHLIAA